jgi:aspartate dehydrogenase
MVGAPAERAPLRVGLLGHGAIGSVLARELLAASPAASSGASAAASSGASAAEHGAKLVLTGIVGSSAPERLRCADVDELIAVSDLVVEAAGQEAVRAHGQRILAAGRDLLVASVGAFADDALLARLRAAAESSGGGRLLLSTGAMGGLDLLRAAAMSGGLDTVRIVTTKPAVALLDDGTPPELRAAAERGEPVVLLDGSAREAAVRFPASTNAALTVALSTLGLDATRVQVVADAAATVVTHRIEASGPIGRYGFTIENRPSVNPRTSEVTAYALLRALEDEGARSRLV